MLRLLVAVVVFALVSLARAQPATPISLSVRSSADTPQIAPLLEPEAVRSALESELGTKVVLAGETPDAHVLVEGRTLEAIRIAFVRGASAEPGVQDIERIVDVTSTREHAAATVALIAASLLRDEAAELLVQLRAANAEPVPAPAPVPAPQAQLTPVAPVLVEPPAPRGCDAFELTPIAIGADFVPYLGTSYRDRGREERRWSINAVGWSGGLRGFELSVLGGLQARGVCGMQLAGGANLTGGPVEGVQLAMLNLARGQVQGMQLGMVNGTASMLGGAQVGITNIAGRRVEGLQLGWLNVSGELRGAQVGLANIGAGPVRGAQVGLANISSGRVNGAMVGLLNVARDADAPIGIVNVLWEGRTHLDLWAGDAGLLFVGVEHGGARVHNIFGIGAGARHGEVVLAPVYGIGVRAAEAEHVYADIDALAHLYMTHDDTGGRFELSSLMQLRVPVGVRFTREVSLWIAPAVSVSFAADDDTTIADPLLYDSVRLSKQNASWPVHLWPGLSIGARFF